MSMRVSTSYTYRQFLNGIQSNQFALTQSQAQISSGYRLMRPSDDPSGTSRVIGLNSRLAHTMSYSKSAMDGRSRVDYSASVLQDTSELLTEIRTLLVQSMNGTLSDDDRKSLGTEISFLRDQMVELGNSRLSGRYVFGGSATGSAPFDESTVGGVKHVKYLGNKDHQNVPVGEGLEIPINVSGAELFAKNEATGTSFAGLTGLASGTTADMGTGFEYLSLRHDGTSAPGLAGLGVSLVNGGDDDEVLGSHSLVFDATAGTVTLSGGKPVLIPAAGDDGVGDVTVVGPNGAEIHLDFSSYSGAGGAVAVTGTGSISIDGSNYEEIDFTDTDLELRNDATGSVLHVNMQDVTRSGQELVQFSGAVNMFDTLQSAVDALLNDTEMTGSEVADRLGMSLTELDRNQSNILGGIGILGARSVRLANTEGRLEGQSLNLHGMISEIRDVDFSEAVLDLTKAEQRLQLVQMSGTRMIKNSLMNFIR